MPDVPSIPVRDREISADLLVTAVEAEPIPSDQVVILRIAGTAASDPHDRVIHRSDAYALSLPAAAQLCRLLRESVKQSLLHTPDNDQ